MRTHRLWIGAITMTVLGCWFREMTQAMLGLALGYIAWANMGQKEYELELEPEHIKRLVDAYEIEGDVVGFVSNLLRDLIIKKK